MPPPISDLPVPKAAAPEPTPTVAFGGAATITSDFTPDFAPAVGAPEVPSGGCPKCGKALVDPTGLGWCAGCGYCKSLADEKRLVDQSRPVLGGMVEAGGGAVQSLPLWFWASGLILAIGITISIFVDKRLPTGDNFDRALWASLQIAIGLFIIFLAQCWALVSIAPEETTLTFKDALTSFRLWVLVFKRLPRLKEALWAAVFGLSLIIGSAAFIGGFVHWFDYLPKNAAARELENARKNSPPVVVPVD